MRYALDWTYATRLAAAWVLSTRGALDKPRSLQLLEEMVSKMRDRDTAPHQSAVCGLSEQNQQNPQADSRLRFPVSAPYFVHIDCHSVPVSCLAIPTVLALQDSGRRCCFSFRSQVLFSLSHGLGLVSTERWGLAEDMQGQKWALSRNSVCYLPCLFSYLCSLLYSYLSAQTVPDTSGALPVQCPLVAFQTSRVRCGQSSPGKGTFSLSIVLKHWFGQRTKGELLASLAYDVRG